MITAKIIKESFEIDDLGRLRWRIRPIHHFQSPHGQFVFNGQFAGGLALTSKDKDGYLRGTITIKGVQMSIKAHLVFYCLHFGKLPTGIIDHIDGDILNNKKENLRLVSASQNSANRKVHCNNACGERGVIYEKSRGKWRADIGFNGKRKTLGRFLTKEDAVSARKKAEAEWHGKFSRG